jgi:predicted enzyme related to lactoylglutathione lyase
VSLELFAGIPVSDLAVAKVWYEKLFGTPPTFLPNDTEAVWTLADQRHVYVEQLPGRAGRALVTLFVDDFDELLPRIAGRGLDPAEVETYDNGVRKAIFRDPDGNEVGFGGGPAD